jgi:dihydroorotate dehydrogenase
MYKHFLKPIFFLFQPEKAHHIVFFLLRTALFIPGMKSIFKKCFVLQDDLLKTSLFGIDFPSPIGLAAGLDKNAAFYQELSYCGFGFIEVGTVTPLSQPGNPQPRLFRLPKDEALINRMGFNNHGVVEMCKKLERNKTVIIGGNIGKNKVTPNENAIADYLTCFQQLFPHIHYFVVNVSSPNTPNLRELQEKEPLSNLLNALMECNRTMHKTKPILLKIAPDLTDTQLLDIIDIVHHTEIDGLIATNTTVSRNNLKTDSKIIDTIGNGGLSGKPLHRRSVDVVRFIRKNEHQKIPIIGVGGIHSAEDAIEMLEAGADLVQVYTGFIYEGPILLKKMNKKILEWRKKIQTEKK